MTVAATATGRPRAATRLAPFRQRAYLGCIAGLAAFLAVLVVAARPGAQPTGRIEAVIGRSVGARPAASKSRASDDLTAPERVSAAMESALGGEPGSADPEAVEHFSQTLVASPWRTDSEGHSRRMLTYTGDRPEGASVVNALAQQYVQSQRPTSGEAASPAPSATAVDAAKMAVAELRQRLDEYSTSANQDAPQAVGDERPETTSQVIPSRSSQLSPNPAWLALQQQAGRLKAERTRLLEQFTTAHPDVLRLDEELQLIEERMRTTAEFLAEEARAPRPATSAGPADHLPPSALDEAQSHTDDELNALRNQLAAAENELAQAQAAAGDAVNVPSQPPRGELFVETWAAPPPRQGARLWTVALLALVAAVVCGGTLASRCFAAEPTFRSSDHVAKELGLPVAAVLKATERATGPRPLMLTRPARLARFASEVTVAWCLGCVLLVAVVNGSFRHKLLREPLSALPEGVWRVAEKL